MQKNITIETILKVFNALKANIKLNAQINDSSATISFCKETKKIVKQFYLNGIEN